MADGRSRSSKASGVREAIHTLSLMLSAVNLPRLASEVFRQAKLDSEDANDSMLELLHQSCVYVNQLPKSGEIRANLHFTPSPFPAKNKQWVKISVMKCLYSLGYRNVDFFCERTSSRQLLLAFGWLMHRCQLVQHFTEYHLYLINHPTLPQQTCPDSLLDHLMHSVQEWTDELTAATSSASDITSQIHRLIWLSGRFKHEYNALSQTVSAYQSLCQSLHLHEGPRSVFEAVLLRYPEHLNSYCKQVAHHLAALQVIEEWGSQASVFWQWMESVYDLQESSTVRIEQTSDLQPLLSEVSHLEKRVKDLVANCRPHIDRLNKVIHSLTLHASDKTVQPKPAPELDYSCGLYEHKAPDKKHNYRTRILSLQPCDCPVSSKTEKQERRTGRGGAGHVIISQQETTNCEQIRTDVCLQLAALMDQLPQSVCIVNRKL